MRMLMNILIPHEEFNEAIEAGTVEETLKKILDDAKPEAVYFTESQGQRAAIMVVDVKEPSQVPSFAEPWYLAFNADVEFRVAMTPKDVGKAGLDKLAKKWL